MSTRALTRKPTKLTGWVAFLDIYAFRAILSAKTVESVSQGLVGFYQEIDGIFARFDIKLRDFTHYRLFSDTIVVWCASDQCDHDRFNKFIEIIYSIILKSTSFNFIIRGALSFGDIVVGDHFILGDAFLRSYMWESTKLLDPIVVIPMEELRNAGLYDALSAAARSINIKSTDQRNSCSENNPSTDATSTIIQAYILPEANWDEQLRIAKYYATISSGAQIERWERVANRAQELKNGSAN